MCLPEDPIQLVGSEFEDALYIATYEEPIDEGAASGAVAHFVNAECATVALMERVPVIPEGVRASQLHIDERVGRVPLGDLATPTDGEAMNADAIIDA